MNRLYLTEKAKHIHILENNVSKKIDNKEKQRKKYRKKGKLDMYGKCLWGLIPVNGAETK